MRKLPDEMVNDDIQNVFFQTLVFFMFFAVAITKRQNQFFSN